MPDCASCNRPLGGANRRCKQCGRCESCCTCYDEDTPPVMFTPAELGLDPEHYDREEWERRRWRNARKR